MRTLVYGFVLLLCLSLAGAADARPPKGGNGGGGNGGGGGPGGGGGKTSLTIEIECAAGVCGLRSDNGGSYYDGVDGVQAFINSSGEEIVFNTGKRGDPRDVHWGFNDGIELLNGMEITDTEDYDPTTHRSIIDLGRNAGVNIRDLTSADGDVAIDMWADVSFNFTGRKKDATSAFPRFESARAAASGGQRCLEDNVIPGVSMAGTDVTISCADDSSGSCTAWVIEGVDPNLGDDAMACTYAVFPTSEYRDDYSFGHFRIRATAQ
ncbi:MAG: hypothetical protein ACR2QX_01615 [Woeseiaceae bacterium]